MWIDNCYRLALGCNKKHRTQTSPQPKGFIFLNHETEQVARCVSAKSVMPEVYGYVNLV